MGEMAPPTLTSQVHSQECFPWLLPASFPLTRGAPVPPLASLSIGFSLRASDGDWTVPAKKLF
jgi:hypothetical protein